MKRGSVKNAKLTILCKVYDIISFICIHIIYPNICYSTWNTCSSLHTDICTRKMPPIV